VSLDKGTFKGVDSSVEYNFSEATGERICVHTDLFLCKETKCFYVQEVQYDMFSVTISKKQSNKHECYVHMPVPCFMRLPATRCL
jgi:hypothetical protein